ncbi:MAG: NADH-quinone oxidoreductase subunit N [Alphaproteobacteria bacterium MarineAlpha4_Bin2]|nr:MAG: NADH-quinone oxidoreductase subunit N [Alphaproteobacteria bacterium MarineAlpha4_Bin2]|tara:strand:- start:516 stop:1964 length:1449 start_codon:yes stop_codon:yes gene_type:complete
MSNLPNFYPALPEILLACATMAFMMVGVFTRAEKSLSVVYLLSLIALVVIGIVLLTLRGQVLSAFNGQFVSDDFAVFMKLLVLLGSFLTLIMSQSYLRRENMARFEYPILILFATVGMMMMISANDLIALYLGLELQSLSLYVLAAFKRDTTRSSEAGLKYFVLGALSSGMLLYGCSMIYGFAGTTSFDGLVKVLTGPETASVGLIVGIVFLIAGLAFKISAVPFHMWTPDVYEGAPTPVTAFFAIAPKIAAISLFVRVMIDPFGDLLSEWRQIIVFISILSMLLGALAAIAQTNIKRLMAYSSIGHMGYALIGLAAGGTSGVQGIILYMTIYLAMNAGTFACILSMCRKGEMVENISDLAGLSKTSPMLAAALLVFMFSMAGVPPLAGFFGKLYIFLAAIEAQLYALAIIGVVSSVVGAFYYLRIVKIMYFDDAAEPFDRPLGKGLGGVVTITGLVTLFFFFVMSPVLDGAAAAAAALIAR